MDAARRHAVPDLLTQAIPAAPGVYALYRDGSRTYVGKATSLQSRIGAQHCGRGSAMTSSALRRNICQLLGIAPAADISSRRYRPTSTDAERVTEWLSQCEFAWVECASPSEALALETAMRAEFKPPLNSL